MPVAKAPVILDKRWQFLHLLLTLHSKLLTTCHLFLPKNTAGLAWKHTCQYKLAPWLVSTSSSATGSTLIGRRGRPISEPRLARSGYNVTCNSTDSGLVCHPFQVRQFLNHSWWKILSLQYSYRRHLKSDKDDHSFVTVPNILPGINHADFPSRITCLSIYGSLELTQPISPFSKNE